MDLRAAEAGLRWLAGLALLAPMLAVFWGLWRSLRRPAGRATGRARQVLRAPAYLVLSVLFFGACVLLWRPMPVSPSTPLHLALLASGGVLYFPGLALVLWGRLALGSMYDVSSSLGARLYANHRLITRGPFALVRHPMYLGIMLGAWGGLLIFRTWTLAFLALAFLGLALRARQEERVLADAFGEAWAAYTARVPAWIPRLKRS